ncbi:MAG: hypothetical protein LBE13_18250, partial [Bacteroidales bacterium]|nr:hypothetical protein [Bacteroidales bacterium]
FQLHFFYSDTENGIKTQITKNQYDNKRKTANFHVCRSVVINVYYFTFYDDYYIFWHVCVCKLEQETL